MMFDHIWDTFKKIKNHDQWRGKALAIGVNIRSVAKSKGTGETGRLIALRFMSLTPEERGKCKLDRQEFTANDGRPKSHWITQELDDFIHGEITA